MFRVNRGGRKSPPHLKKTSDLSIEIKEEKHKWRRQ